MARVTVIEKKFDHNTALRRLKDAALKAVSGYGSEVYAVLAEIEKRVQKEGAYPRAFWPATYVGEIRRAVFEEQLPVATLSSIEGVVTYDEVDAREGVVRWHSEDLLIVGSNYHPALSSGELKNPMATPGEYRFIQKLYEFFGNLSVQVKLQQPDSLKGAEVFITETSDDDDTNISLAELKLARENGETLDQVIESVEKESGVITESVQISVERLLAAVKADYGEGIPEPETVADLEALLRGLWPHLFD